MALLPRPPALVILVLILPCQLACTRKNVAKPRVLPRGADSEASIPMALPPRPPALVILVLMRPCRLACTRKNVARPRVLPQGADSEAMGTQNQQVTVRRAKTEDSIPNTTITINANSKGSVQSKDEDYTQTQRPSRTTKSIPDSSSRRSMDNPAPPSPENPIPTICPFINIPNELHLEILVHLCDGDWSVSDHISVIMALLYTTGNQALDCYIGTLAARSYPQLLHRAVREQLPVICLGRILTRLPVEHVDAMPAVTECIQRNAVEPLQLLLKFRGGQLAMRLGYAILIGHTESAVVMAKGMDKEDLTKAVEGQRKIDWGDPGISVLTIVVQAVQGCQLVSDQLSCSSSVSEGLQARAASCLEAVVDVVNERLDNSRYPQPCPLQTLAECVLAIPESIADPMRNQERDWIEIGESGEWTWRCRAIELVRREALYAATRGVTRANVKDRIPGPVETAAMSDIGRLDRWRQLWVILLRVNGIAHKIAKSGGTRRMWDLPKGFLHDLLDTITFSVSARRKILMWAVRFRDPEKTELVFSRLGPPFPTRCVEDANVGRVKLFPPGALGGLWNAVIDDVLETGTLSPAVELIKQMDAHDAGVHARHEHRNGVPLLHALVQLGFLHPETMATEYDTEDERRERETIFLARRSPLRQVISMLIGAGARTEEAFQWRHTKRDDCVTQGAPRYFLQTAKSFCGNLVYNQYELEGQLGSGSPWGLRRHDIHTPQHVALWARCVDLFPAWTQDWSLKGLCHHGEICAVPPLLAAAALTDADAVLKLCTPQDVSQIIASLETITELGVSAYLSTNVIANMVFVLVTVVKNDGSGGEEMERWDVYCVKASPLVDCDKRPYDFERTQKGFYFVAELFQDGNWRREHADAPWARALLNIEKAGEDGMNM
ncbi:hypothetical protein FN846DRAFT_889657 [Sphaerosporella brunnea]|uniref:Ankyrin repeat-containing domain protein n=1 Tax=Sphaerosporella brunnea TaxID=1250544 RepID=A0A5J5EZ40_9PEZI|nr:hypothetical protein FN846DRAFT_889657 [Sphaerosporella brunnea]